MIAADPTLAASYTWASGLVAVVSDDLAESVVEGIQMAANTGRIGDGKIFMMDVGQAVRIRTGETNGDAL